MSLLGYWIVAYGTIGGFGVALYRIIYIKVPHFAKEIGDQWLLGFIGIGGILSSIAFAVLYGFYGEATGRQIYNSCNGYTEKFQVRALLFITADFFDGKLLLSLSKCDFKNSKPLSNSYNV